MLPFLFTIYMGISQNSSDCIEDECKSRKEYFKLGLIVTGIYGLADVFLPLWAYTHGRRLLNYLINTTDTLEMFIENEA